MKSYLNIITVDSFIGSDVNHVAGEREMENVIYTNFDAFSAGSVTNVNVFGSQYEANQPNVEYDWIFILNDNIPKGGLILLKFPPNYFSLESTPLPIGTITSNNLELDDTTKGFFSFKTNVATLSNFKSYTAGTLLTIKFTGVKNPITEGQTIEFGIESQTLETYTIDLKADIPGVDIIAANSMGQISYNYFYTSPNNGYVLGNYYVNFILQNSIPKYGEIEITFPLNFDITPTPFNADASGNIECYISGPITLISSCQVSGIVISLIILEPLVINAGTPPVTIYFPNIYNYNSELDSGPVTIRTIYDNVILDDSGDSETNRKATTGVDSSLMVTGVNYMNFLIEPKTESVSAFYNITILPINSFNSSAMLQFVFPKIFPRGLGSSVSCSSNELQKSDLDPLSCTVKDYVLNISNLNAFNNSNNSKFTVSLSGIINPSQMVVPITTQIAFYIYNSPNTVLEYTYKLGALAYDKAPPILYMSNFIYGSNNTRVISNYGFSMLPLVSASFSFIMIDFPSIFNLEDLWNNKTYSLSLENVAYSQGTVIENTLFTGVSGSLNAGTGFTMNIYEIFNPMVEVKSPYPVFFVYDGTTYDIVMKSYNNLNQFDTPDFFNNGLIITIADDIDSLAIEAG